MDIIQHEFSCSHEIFVLPKVYGTLDSDFNMAVKSNVEAGECRHFQKVRLENNINLNLHFFMSVFIPQVQYLHFTDGGKPWTRGKNRNENHYLNKLSEEASYTLREWFDEANQVCPNYIKIPN